MVTVCTVSGFEGEQEFKEEIPKKDIANNATKTDLLFMSRAPCSIRCSIT